MWKDSFGHTNIKQILGGQIRAGLLYHAYLFTGPEGVGKKRVALEFAKKVLGTENLGNHPDFELFELSGEITMEPVLGLISRLKLKPFIAQKKVAIINDAQNLNTQSSNALLKTLEEPAKDTAIILISTS
jgi:DNA polymerase III subunit delta'